MSTKIFVHLTICFLKLLSKKLRSLKNSGRHDSEDGRFRKVADGSDGILGIGARHNRDCRKYHNAWVEEPLASENKVIRIDVFQELEDNSTAFSPRETQSYRRSSVDFEGNK